MAVLEKIRNKATLLAIIIGIALFSFIVGDFLRSGFVFFNQKKENILTVNGESINYRDYILNVDNRINTIKENNNNHSLTDYDQYRVRQIVLNEIIDDILFDKEIKKLGLVISKEEFKNLIIGNHISSILKNIPFFQNQHTKKFDKTILLQFLQTICNEDYSMYSEKQIKQLMYMKKIWLDIEKQIIKNQLKKKFNILFTYASLTNYLEARTFYENNKISVDFDYVIKSYNSIPDREIFVSNTEIQNLYRKLKKNYERKEIALIDYITLDISPSKEDFQAVKNRLTDLRKQLKFFKNIDVAKIIQSNPDINYTNTYIAYNNLNKNQKHLITENSVGSIGFPILTNRTFDLYKFEKIKIAPDSIKLNVLIIPPIKDKIKFTYLCDSLINVIKHGTSFENVTSSIYKKKITNESGWTTESQLISKMNSQFKDKVFEAKINEPTIIKTNIGTFLIQVVKKTRPIKKYKILHIKINVLPSQKTKIYLYNKLNQIISSNHSLKNFDLKIKVPNLNIQTNVKLSKNQININGIQNTRQIVQWAFKNKKHIISNIFECQNGKYFMVVIIKKHFKENCYSKPIFNLLKRDLINKKKAKKIITKFKRKKINTLEEYAKLMNTKLKSVQSLSFETSQIHNIGEEPMLSIKILEANADQIFGPYIGKQGVYVFHITKKKFKKENYDVNLFQKKAQEQNIYHIYQIVKSCKFLRENAKINNYYDRFF